MDVSNNWFWTHMPPTLVRVELDMLVMLQLPTADSGSGAGWGSMQVSGERNPTLSKPSRLSAPPKEGRSRMLGRFLHLGRMASRSA